MYPGCMWKASIQGEAALRVINQVKSLQPKESTWFTQPVTHSDPVVSFGSRLEYHDCDGDDILDPYCVAADKLSFGYISTWAKKNLFRVKGWTFLSIKWGYIKGK